MVGLVYFLIQEDNVNDDKNKFYSRSSESHIYLIKSSSLNQNRSN